MADVRPRAVHVRGREAVSEREWGNALALLGLANREREQQGGAEGMDAWRFGGVRARAWLPRTGQVSPVEALHRAHGGQRCG
jgi:hypothetical protein